MKVKIFKSWSENALEYNLNKFLSDNQNKIEVVEMKWKWIFEHYVMIIYKEIVQSETLQLYNFKKQ